MAHAKKKHNKAAITLLHLHRPYHKSYVKRYQDNVISQARFLNAQNAMQN